MEKEQRHLAFRDASAEHIYGAHYNHFNMKLFTCALNKMQLN